MKLQGVWEYNSGGGPGGYPASFELISHPADEGKSEVVIESVYATVQLGGRETPFHWEVGVVYTIPENIEGGDSFDLTAAQLAAEEAYVKLLNSI